MSKRTFETLSQVVLFNQIQSLLVSWRCKRLVKDVQTLSCAISTFATIGDGVGCCAEGCDQPGTSRIVKMRRNRRIVFAPMRENALVAWALILPSSSYYVNLLWRREQVERLTCFNLFCLSHRQIGSLSCQSSYDKP